MTHVCQNCGFDGTQVLEIRLRLTEPELIRAMRVLETVSDLIRVVDKPIMAELVDQLNDVNNRIPLPVGVAAKYLESQRQGKKGG